MRLFSIIFIWLALVGAPRLGQGAQPTSTSLGAGLYKAVYAVPKSGSLGTYLVLAKAHTTDPLDATSIASFEVKQSWLNSNSPKIVAGATLAAVLGLSVVAWQKGYFKKKEDEIPSF